MKVFVETSHALPIVSVAIAFRSGTTQDPIGKEGLARTTARMLRRGSEGMGADQIEEEVDRLGGEFAADASVSGISIHCEVIRRNLDPFADLLARVIGKPAFDEVELGRLLREATAELIEARDSDRSLASRAFRKTLFAGHPYGRRSAGTLASLEAITAADVRAFYQRHYNRKNALVAVSGDIERAEAEALADKLLSHLPEGEEIKDEVEEPTAPAGRHLVIVDKADRTQTQMVIGGVGTDTHDEDHFDLFVGNTIFGGTFTSRLMNEVRSKRGWSYGASSNASFNRKREAFTMWTAPGAKDAAACLTLELELLSTLRKQGVDDAELGFVKSYLSRSHAFDVDTARKRVHQELEEALIDMPSGYHSGYLSHIDRCTKDSVNAALARRLPEDNLVVGVVATYAEIGKALEGAGPNWSKVTVLPFDFE